MVKNIAILGSPVLTMQINAFVDGLEAFNEKREPEKQRSIQDYDFLRDFFLRFFEDRNSRALDVQSTIYERVKELALSEFPVSTYWNLCMDGRVKTVLTNGATAGVGASIRIPGGILREFIRGTDGNFKLLANSNFAQTIERALLWSESGVIAEVFDSHVACAARKVEEEARGRDLEDFGLLSDVLHKKEMLQALDEFIEKTYGPQKHIIGIQTSFGPHDGYMYMGLETDAAIVFAKEEAKKREMQTGKKKRWEYTTDVLDALVQENKIIYTKELVALPEIARLFQTHAFTPNWSREYVISAKSFWENIQEMKKDVLPVMKERLLTIYPHLKKTDRLFQIELEERAMLLLTNAFIGYIHNQGEYPYAVHREECVKISRGGFSPYEISAFVVLGDNDKTITADVELAAALVRNNRKLKNVSDRSGNFSDPDEFAQAPVPLIVQEILQESLPDAVWQKVLLVDWSDMPIIWDRMSDQDFFRYLETKGEVHLIIANAINKLRHTMAVLFDPTVVTAGRLVSHHKIALPVMVDRNRINYFIVPFVKHGFE